MQGRVRVLLLCLAVTGCRPPATPTPSAAVPTPPALGTRFDATQCGTIAGKVVWEGADPRVAPLRYTGVLPGVPREVPNPYAPSIDAKSRGVQALVFLRTVDEARARRWNHAEVEVILGKDRIVTQQAGVRRPVGIVRQGDEIAAWAAEGKQHILLGRRADFFSLPLREPDKVTRRKLEKPGWVELSSGDGLYWLRGHLWVSPHPYVTLTASDGSYTLREVPTGKYEVVSWLPSWHLMGEERNAESGEIDRLVFAPAVERGVTCEVIAGAEARADVTWSEIDFVKK